MSVKELKLFATTGGKIYQSKEDAESFQKKEDFIFDYESLDIFSYITIHFDNANAKPALDSGKFLTDLKELEQLYLKIYQPENQPPNAPKKETVKNVGIYDKISQKIYNTFAKKRSA
jgi:hypothetical protein